jgi:hypothetical protein
VARLDQLTEIWIHLFVGIGVVWTAIGMRDALGAALAVEAGPDPAPRAPDDVLRALVDGGILVALSSTIVGGLGGYAMKLLKALVAGGALQRFYGALGTAEMHRLQRSVATIAGSVVALEHALRSRPGAPAPGRTDGEGEPWEGAGIVAGAREWPRERTAPSEPLPPAGSRPRSPDRQVPEEA